MGQSTEHSDVRGQRGDEVRDIKHVSELAGWRTGGKGEGKGEGREGMVR